MLTFKLMTVEGFASIGNEEFHWDLPGLNIIQAPNGFGKSKFVNALIWGLFGKTLTGSVEPWEKVRAKGYKGTLVTIEFIVGENKYKIYRCKDYKGLVLKARGKNRLEITINDDPSPIRSKGDRQQELENILGYSYDLFKNSIIFGQKLKRLVSETGPNKKKVLDEAFDLVYIQKARVIADIQYKQSLIEYQKQLGVCSKVEYQITNLNSLIELEESHIKSFEKAKDEEIQRLKNAISNKELNLKSLEADNISLEDIINSIKSLNDELITHGDLGKLDQEKRIKSNTVMELGFKIKDQERSLKDISPELDSLLSFKPITHCFNCNKPYTPSEIKEEKEKAKKRTEELITLRNNINNNIELYKRQILELNGQISSINNSINNINILLEKFKKLEREKSSAELYEYKLETIKSEINSLKNQIEIENNKTPQNNIDNLTRELRTKILELKKEHKTLRILKLDVSINKWLLDDPLSNSGLRAFIFDHMLDSINQRLEYYAPFINTQVAFIIDLESSRKDIKTLILKYNDLVSYEDLSGGQQQTVDIVSSFAIHDVVSKAKNCSLMIMDELFESLDKDNIEILTELIADKARDKCLYLITHRSEFAPTNSNIINIGYKNGVTYIK